MMGVGVVQTQQSQSLSSMCCSCTNQYQNQKQSKVVKVDFCFSRHSSIFMSSVTNVRRRTSFATRSSSSSSSNDSSSTSTPESNEKEEVDNNNNNNSNRKGPDLKTLVRRFWKVAAPYWYCEEDKVQARWQLAAVFALTLGTTGISVGFNFLGRDFYNALASTFTTTF